MKPETQERIWRTLETLLQEVSGGQPYEASVDELTRFLEWLLQTLPAFTRKTQLVATLSTLDEPSTEALEKFEAVARFVTPFVTTALLRTNLQATLKTLPKPVGGRPERCTPEEKRLIRTEILKAIERGIAESEAKRRIARQRRLSLKTLDRIWKDRRKSSAEEITGKEAAHLLNQLLFRR